MKNPPDELVQIEAKKAFENSVFSATKPLNLPFRYAFEKAIQWLLEWQKTQPLTVYYVMVGELEIVDVCRTHKSAEKSISDLKKDYQKVKFWIDERIIN